MGVVHSKQETEKDFSDNLQAFRCQVQRCRQARTTFCTLTTMWTADRKEATAVLREVAGEVDRHHRNANIACLTGTSSSIVGGTATIGGLVLAPFSGGASLALTAGGLAGTVAGQATAFGATLAEVYLTKELAQRASQALDRDVFYTKALTAALEELMLEEEQMAEMLEKIQDTYSSEQHGNLEQLKNLNIVLEDVLKEGAPFRSIHSKETIFGAAPTVSGTLASSSEFFQALKELTTAGPGISNVALQGTAATQVTSLATQLVTAGLGAVFVAFDIYQLLKTSEDYDQGSKTQLAQKMRAAADDLWREMEQVQKIELFYRRMDLVNTDEIDLS